MHLLLLPPLKLSFCLQAAYQWCNRWLCQAGGLGVTTKSVVRCTGNQLKFTILRVAIFGGSRYHERVLWLYTEIFIYVWLIYQVYMLFQNCWACHSIDRSPDISLRNSGALELDDPEAPYQPLTVVMAVSPLLTGRAKRSHSLTYWVCVDLSSASWLPTLPSTTSTACQICSLSQLPAEGPKSRHGRQGKNWLNQLKEPKNIQVLFKECFHQTLFGSLTVITAS